MQNSNSAQASPPFVPQTSSYRWVILALALTTFTMTFISKFCWPPLIPAVLPDMDINRSQALTYMPAFLVGYVITQIPGGILTDKWGPRRILAMSLFLQGLATAGLGLGLGFEAGFVLRVICGLGAGFVYSACLKAVCSWFSPAQRGLAIGVVMCAPTIGVALPNLILPYLESVSNWQNAFITVGIGIVVLAIMLFLLMKDVASAPPTGPKRGTFDGLKFVFKSRNILLVALAGLSGLWTQIGFSSIGNDYLVTEFKINIQEAGMVMVAYGLVGVVMPTLAGYLCDKFSMLSKQKILLILGHILMGVSCFLFGQMGSLTGAVIAACFLGMGVAFSNSLYAVLISGNTPPEWVATANGATNAIFQVGAVMAPIACGLTFKYTGTYDISWWLLSGGAFLGVIFTIMIRQTAATDAGKNSPSCACKN